jgi:hypothetical protein
VVVETNDRNDKIRDMKKKVILHIRIGDHQLSRKALISKKKDVRTK